MRSRREQHVVLAEVHHRAEAAALAAGTPEELQRRRRRRLGREAGLVGRGGRPRRPAFGRAGLRRALGTMAVAMGAAAAAVAAIAAIAFATVAVRVSVGKRVPSIADALGELAERVKQLRRGAVASEDTRVVEEHELGRWAEGRRCAERLGRRRRGRGHASLGAAGRQIDRVLQRVLRAAELAEM